jgi:hypothetical protein
MTLIIRDARGVSLPGFAGMNHKPAPARNHRPVLNPAQKGIINALCHMSETWQTIAQLSRLTGYAQNTHTAHRRDLVALGLVLAVQDHPQSPSRHKLTAKGLAERAYWEGKV